MSHLPWDVGDEPSVEERIDIAFTQEGQAIFEELTAMDELSNWCPGWLDEFAVDLCIVAANSPASAS